MRNPGSTISTAEKKAVIVGGGFGGVRCALDLAKKGIKNLKIVLVSDKSHFEYHAGLYRVVASKDPLEVCIPLADIFKGLNVEVCEDTIYRIDFIKKMLNGSSGATYKYDYLALALGSETSYFNLPGVKEHSFGFKSIHDALRLKRRLYEIFNTCVVSLSDQVEKDNEALACLMHIVIIGGGPSGVELAGELALYTKELAKKFSVNQKSVRIDLIEAGSRLVPMLSEKISDLALNRLSTLGVNVYLTKTIINEDVEQLYLKDMKLKAKTVIWTAGTKANSLYGELGVHLNARGQVEVESDLRIKGVPNVFVVGDGAVTKFSGMAQTAVMGASVAAINIGKALNGTSSVPYVPKTPHYAVPIGGQWAIFAYKNFVVSGKLGWVLRRYVDLNFMLSILPVSKAFTAFSYGQKLCDTCDICTATIE